MMVNDDKKRGLVEVLMPRDVTKSGFKSEKEALRAYLSASEINEVLNRMPPNSDKVLIFTLWRTGCRVSEVLGLKRRDLDFENKTATIRHLKSRRYEERVIPLQNELCGMLQFYTIGLKVDELVFPITRRQAHRIVVRWFGEGVHPHTFRHSFAVNFLRRSKNPMALIILKNLLGHAHMQDTLIYLKLVPNDLSVAVNEVSFD